MALCALLWVAQIGDFRVVLSAVLSVGLLMAAFWLAQRWLRPLGNINLIIFFVGVAGFCVFTGVPIAFGFGLAIFGYLALTTPTPLMVLVGRMDEGISHLILLSGPLFVFLGLLIEITGLARGVGRRVGGGWWGSLGRGDLGRVKRAGGGGVGRSCVVALPALALPFVIRAAVVEGVATATEVSTIGIVYGLIVGLLVYRQFDWRRLGPMLVGTACPSGGIPLIIGAATGLAWGLAPSGVSR